MMGKNINMCFLVKCLLVSKFRKTEKLWGKIPEKK